MAATDVITLAEAKAFLRISQLDTSDDARLASLITAVSDVMDSQEEWGPIVTRTITDEVVTTSNRAGCRVMTARLRRYPVYSITSVAEYVDGTPTELTRSTISAQPDDGYYAWPGATGTQTYSGAITRTSAGQHLFWSGDALVTYTAGRFPDTTSVSQRFKEAAGVILESWWGRVDPSTEEQGEYVVPKQSFPRFAVPALARLSLWDEYLGDRGAYG